jgi:transposase-like protein
MRHTAQDEEQKRQRIAQARATLAKGAEAITCGQCGEANALEAWTQRPVSGALPVGQFQCPACGYAFQRRETTPGQVWDNGRERFYIPGTIKETACQPEM